MGRPKVWTDCAACETTGRLPSEKRPGNTIKCQKCKGEGKRLVSYTRCTTFIDVLDDKSALMTWAKRMVLIGVATDPKLLNGVLELDPEEKDDKDALNRRAESAATVAGASKKADKGTHLHGLSEVVDEGKELPSEISFGDVIDMDAYRTATRGLKIRHMERLVVNDQYRVGGTPDRVSEWDGDAPLIAPNGYVFEPGSGELMITDLKTGTVDYGALKMAMQLAMYSRSKLYDRLTGARTDMGRVNQEWGIIMHLPAGSGEATLYWADLTLGWEAVALAYSVREIRKQGRHALKPIVMQDTSAQFAHAG